MEEKVIIQRYFHEHPLILTENMDNKESRDCYGCSNPVSKTESAYVCIQEKYCSSPTIFHRKCGELSGQIAHPSHSQHPLHLVDFRHFKNRHSCDICTLKFGEVLGYRCSGCDFDSHVTCNKHELSGAARQLHHPGHINHPLRLLRKPPFVFNCDTCGTTEHRGVAYACAACDLLIHETCAASPLLLLSNHHLHRLSLSFCFPFQHRDLQCTCGVCDQEFDMGCWLYYCADCRYFAHLRCATSTAEPTEKVSS